MTPTLYHCSGARSVRPLWTLLEMGLEHKLITLQFPPRVHNKEFKEINPLGTVPCLIDGSLNMTESAGICQYLADRYGPTDLAVGRDDADYGVYLNWLHRSDATLTFPQTIYFRYTQLEDYKIWFLARLRSVESALEDRQYLCAGRFTLADIVIAYCLFFARRLGIEEAFTPNIQRWYDLVTDRPAFREATR